MKTLLILACALALLLTGCGSSDASETTVATPVPTQPSTTTSQATTTMTSAATTSTTVAGEPLTEEAVKQRTTEYWEACKFHDYGAAYDMLDKAFRAQMTREEFVKRQEWWDSHLELTDIQLIELSSATIDGNRADVRTTLYSSSGSRSDLTKLIYEDGAWRRLFTYGEALGVGVSFEEWTEQMLGS